MGREWYNLSGGTKSSSSSNSSSTSKTPRSRRRDNIKETSSSSSSSKYESTSSSLSTTTTTTTTSTTGGCMSAVFQLFDFHLPLYHHQPTPFKFSTTSTFHDEEPSIDHHVLKVINSSGTEAPRNSLECESSPLEVSSSSDIIRKDEHLLMPKMGIQIKTGRDKRPDMASSPDFEICSSPGTKTPTIVARLMGLDLLPDSTSSSPRTSSTPRPSLHASRTPNRRWNGTARRKSCSDVETSYSGTRSLPETPRMSLGRRSDVDHLHRPTSLHTNKENARRTIAGEDNFDFTRLIKRELKCSSEDGATRSPGHYARQIVKQVKESMSRRVGMIDITNNLRSRSEQAGSTNKDQISKPKKPPRNLRPVTEDSTVPSCSPRLGLPNTNKMRWEVPHCPNADQSGSTKEGTRTRFLRPNCDYRLSSATEFMRNNKQEDPLIRVSKSTRPPSSNHMSNDGGTVVDKKCKPTPSGIKKRGGAPASVATAAAALPVKRDPSPPATKIPHKQVHDIQTNSKQISVSTSHRYRHEAGNMVMVREKGNIDTPSVTTTIATTSITTRQAELHYVSEILRSTGLKGDTRLSSFTGWFTMSHPLDPAIFSSLESKSSACSVDDANNVRHRCDRKLVFELVDQLLADFLKPCYHNHKPWVNVLCTGSQLVDKLRSKIESFPRADCQVLEDIDAIIDVDLPKCEVRGRTGLEEEGNDIVSQVERDIWEDLVREVVTEEPLIIASGRAQVGVVRKSLDWSHLGSGRGRTGWWRAQVGVVRGPTPSGGAHMRPRGGAAVG